MKIKLISAAVRSRSKWSQIMTLSLPASAAATPEVHDITIEDERVKKIHLDDTPDLVGISFEVFRAYWAFKQPNAVATITRLIANVGHRVNCLPVK